MKHQDIISQLTLEEKCYLLSGKDFWQTRSVERVGIPSITLSDGPHGVRKQEGAGDQLGLNGSLPATCFPTAATIANSWDPDLGEAIGRCLGEEAASQDVNVLLGPGMNIKRSPLCGRNFEYFSEDPYLAGKTCAGYIRGIQANGVSACPKHFAANNTELRRMASDSVVDERTLREIYLTGFEIAVKEAHPKSLMSSYNRVNGVYANENPHTLQEILRDEWGFDGFVVSDWGGSNDHVEGVRAGSHLEMPTTGGDSDAELIQAVKDGRIEESIVDRRVDELLDVVFATRAAVDKTKGQSFDQDAHHAMAQKASEESIVLLKNEDNILPLAAGTKVAVIGDFAETPRYQGAGSSVVNCTKLDSANQVMGQFDLNVVGFEKGYPRVGAGDAAMQAAAVELAKKADVALLYLGLDEISESEGLDRGNMKLPQSQVDLLCAVAEVNPNVVVVMAAGSSIEMPWLDKCKGLLHGYLCGQAGAAALLKAVTGQINPSGKLSETYPIAYEDTPSAPYFPAKQRNAEYREGLYVGYRYFETVQKPVLFPFGFGLSYTTFAYSDLKVNGDKVTFTLTNTGKVDGAEVAQLYVSAKNPSIYRPVKELKGFQKVFLKAGERKTVTIALDDKAFRYFNTKTNQFEVDGGEYDILIGASVADIKLRAAVTVTGTDAPLPYDMSQLPSYASGNILAVSDAEWTTLLGHPIPDGSWSGTLEANDALCQLYYAKSGLARLIYKIMTNMLDKSMAKGKPDLNIIFVYNMPFRGIGKMTGGMVSQYMVEGLLKAANGHFFAGVGQFISGFFKQKKVAKHANEMK
ncbi:MAG: glycoside hydrolase family 3 C-terminal domain-containing protein [Clostridiales bacterium]|nr:glycoside hydrolase family 3 C-terminal domain-containing protein [Clostridiales bacterium]